MKFHLISTMTMGASGVFIGEGIGAEPSTLTFMSINNGDGDVLFSDLWGTDADDTDPKYHSELSKVLLSKPF